MLTERFGASAPAVSSVGTIARDGAPATREAIVVASEHGIDASSHAARRLVRKHLAEASLVLAMTAEHRDAVARADPRATTKTFTLKELVRLLEDLPAQERAGDPASLELRIAEADAHRRAGSAGNPHDEDVADPIGHPVETYRAVAWELAAWSERLVEALFDATPPLAAAERPSRAGESP